MKPSHTVYIRIIYVYSRIHYHIYETLKLQSLGLCQTLYVISANFRPRPRRYFFYQKLLFKLLLQKVGWFYESLTFILVISTLDLIAPCNTNLGVIGTLSVRRHLEKCGV